MVRRFVKHLMQAAAVAMTALVLSAQAQPVKLRVSTIPIIDTAPLQVAIAKGFFAAEGLEVDTPLVRCRSLFPTSSPSCWAPSRVWASR